MSTGNLVAVVSVIATALASGYGTYMQYVNNQNQQEKVLELEKFKVSSELEMLEAKAKIERFNSHCSKIEDAIKHTSSLVISSFKRDQDVDFKEKDFSSHVYLYLLAQDSQAVARKSYDSDDNNDTWASTMYASLIFEYRKCVQIDSK
ncbi:hypothetical protein HKA89_03135 [Vibrio parahaemolyticus]|uniref:hypothetical protein n=1 Tax=Vibrio parahaemolyticus TaxID=670 RepID=UPI00146B0538|nr:hypothetical protein [Vibrio parahaemolyticus]MDF5281048.1 hypothetical protein [Vibrio parahaemolyticus]NMU67757.1 hypothetical protein [Vibrio parahaemolyticus]